MKTFKTFIVEIRMTTVGEITAAIAGYKKAGEILNPVYIDLVGQAKRVMNYSGQESKPRSILDLLRDHRDDDDLDELYYTSFDGFQSHNKIEKLVTKLEKKKVPAYSKMIKDVKEYLKVWKPVGQDLKDLKSKVVKVTQKRAEAKASAETVMQRKFADSSSLIKIFESHMQEYKDMAEKRAREFINSRLESLKKVGWDIDKVAPRPNSNYGYGTDYKTASAKRSFYTSITTSKRTTATAAAPDIVEPDRAAIDRYVKVNVQAAEDAYRSFMEKMIQKIGKPVIKATMTGNIWTNATLHVITNDNEEQVWNTKMIINFSKYQAMFNQFPSRRKK